MRQQAVNPGLCIRQAIVGDVQVDLGEVVDDLVRRLGQQLLEVFPCFVQLSALDLGDRQTIARHIAFRVFIQQGAEALGAQAWGFFIDQLDPGTNQLITQGVFDAALRGLLGAVAGVGDTRFGHRVSQQEFRRLGVEAVLTPQAFEHGRHGAGVVACLFQIEDTDAIGFLFVLARESPLFLDGCRLCPCNRRNTGIAGTCRGNHDTGQQRGHHRYLHALLGLDATGKVALRQVSQFVGQYRGILAFGLRIEEQAAVDPDNPAGRRERVELRAVDQDELQAPVIDLAGLHQAVDAGLDVVLELRVVELRHLAAQQGKPGAAQLVFLLRRDNGRTGVAE
ncbi:hypothetical protein D3C76_754950 [compost metagenome]